MVKIKPECSNIKVSFRLVSKEVTQMSNLKNKIIKKNKCFIYLFRESDSKKNGPSLSHKTLILICPHNEQSD